MPLPESGKSLRIPIERIRVPTKPEPSGTVKLSVAEHGDVEALAALRIEAMRESLEQIGRFDPIRARERFLSSFVPENTRHILVAGERVGFLVVKVKSGEFLLDHLYVKPSFQNRGVGAAVLAQVFAEASARSLLVRVGALRESASNRFYTRHGFQFVERGEFDNYYIRPSKNAP